MDNKTNLLRTLTSNMLQNAVVAADFNELCASFMEQACLFRCICHLGGIDRKEDQLAIALIARRLGLMQADFFVDHHKICTLVSLISGTKITYKGKEVPVGVNTEVPTKIRVVDHWVFKDPSGHFVCDDYDPKPGTNAVTRGKVVGHRVYEVSRG